MSGFNELGAHASKEDVLLFRLVKLFQSIKQVSEILVELLVDATLFLTSLLSWTFQFNSYLVSFLKSVLRVAARISDLATLQQKIYILVTIVALYLLIYTGAKVRDSLKRLRRHYHMKWSALINHLLFVLSPYLIFTLAIYLPLCIIVPKFYFEAVLVRIWILWIPMAKAVTSAYRSLLGDDHLPWSSQISQAISALERYNNTDFILSLLETISACIGSKCKKPSATGYHPPDNQPLALLNSKSSMAKEITQIKVIQCWVDYFNLWIIYFFLKNYFLGNNLQFVSNAIINYFKASNIFILNTINVVSNSNPRLSSKILQPLAFLLKPPAYIIKCVLILVINMNWKYLIISIIVLNILFQIKFIQDHDNCFSIIFEDLGVSIGIASTGYLPNPQDEDEDDEDDEDQDQENHHNKHRQRRRSCSPSPNNNRLIIYEYPSLSKLLRNYIILIIDWVSSNLLGISLFSQIYNRSETLSGSPPPNTLIQLNPKSITKSLPSITKEKLKDATSTSTRTATSVSTRDRKTKNHPTSTKPELLHSNTMPHLSLSGTDDHGGDDRERKSSSQLKIIMNLLDNNLVINWLPENWRSSCLLVVENMISKSSKFKYWVLVTIILIGQVPQWVVLLLPSFIVNLFGCMTFGYLYPLVMSLRTSCYIGDSYFSPNSKTNEKLQACIIYLILFNLLNEVLSINKPLLTRGVSAWIPFKVHSYYLAILLIQLTSSIIPICSKQIKLKTC